MNIKDIFEKYDSEYMNFWNCTEKSSGRPDLCAFAILDRLVPLDRLIPRASVDMVSAAEHDEIFLSVEPEEVERVATDEDIANLIRCGVMHNSSLDCFSMFV